MTTSDLEELRVQVQNYLLDAIEAESHYVKSRHIARSLDVSVKRVGRVMTRIERDADKLDLKRWGGASDGVTWYVGRSTNKRRRG